MYAPQTIAQAVSIAGVGLHTGAEARVTIREAPPGQGRVFLRDGVRIPATVDHVVDTRRCTTLGHAGRLVHTVEHLLAALLLAEIDDAEIEIDGEEVPALDGSAWQWYLSITAAGVRQTGEEQSYIRIADCRWLAEETAEFFLTPAATLTVYAGIDFPDTIVTRMMAGGRIDDPAVREQILRARTFGREAEVEALRAAGLARGASLDNALVLTREGYRNAMVWPNEPAWHKVLDALGDLALIGRRPRGQVTAVRAGHRHHVALARQLVTLARDDASRTDSHGLNV